jgi:hypothetical protein
MKKAILMTLAMAVLAVGQQAEKKEGVTGITGSGPRMQKVLHVKHANVDSLWAAFNHIANIRVDKTLKLLVVDGSPEAIKAIEDSLKTLDVPPPAIKNVEMTFHMILAKPAKNGALPAGLESVQKNLESLFGFRGFHLLETAYMRGRDGIEVSTSGAVPNPAEPESAQKITYNLVVHPVVASSDKGNMIRLDRLRLVLRMPVVASVDTNKRPTGYTLQESAMATQIDVREGQRVVVGKANVTASDGAMVLVVTAKVVE